MQSKSVNYKSSLFKKWALIGGNLEKPCLYITRYKLKNFRACRVHGFHGDFKKQNSGFRNKISNKGLYSG